MLKPEVEAQIDAHNAAWEKRYDQERIIDLWKKYRTWAFVGALGALLEGTISVVLTNVSWELNAGIGFALAIFPSLLLVLAQQLSIKKQARIFAVAGLVVGFGLLLFTKSIFGNPNPGMGYQLAGLWFSVAGLWISHFCHFRASTIKLVEIPALPSRREMFPENFE